MFREYTGISPIKYMHKIRIEKAQSLLLTTNMPVKAIAYEMGYNDEYHFSRLFKKHTGLSPKNFRNFVFYEPE